MRAEHGLEFRFAVAVRAYLILLWLTRSVAQQFIQTGFAARPLVYLFDDHGAVQAVAAIAGR